MPIKKVAFEFDPFKELGIKIRPDRRDEALDDVKEYVKDQVLLFVGEASTPVDGGKWKKKLDPEYAKRKKAEGGTPIANLELTGEMLDALEVVNKRGTKLSLQIEGDQAPKADGHNNFSGDSNLPERNFIPNKKAGQDFKREIWAGIRQILEQYEDDDSSGD